METEQLFDSKLQPVPTVTPRILWFSLAVYVLISLTFTAVSFALILSVIPVVVLSIYFLGCSSHSCHNLHFHNSDKKLQTASDVVLKEAVQLANLKVQWTEAVVEGVSLLPFHIHSLVIWQNDEVKDKPKLLLLHGTGGSSVTFRKVLDDLSKDYEVHAVDLPGFGRSLAPVAFRKASNQEVVDAYCDVLHQYINAHSLGQVVLVGHSFGGFIASEYVLKYPATVSKLLLVNPAGLLPVLGTHGAYWALLFKLSLPQSLLRLLSGYGALMYGVWHRCRKAGSFSLYNYQLLAAPSGFADLFVGRFIHLGFFWSYWTNPTISHLLSCSTPLAFIYGERDTLMPAHQGETFVAVSDSKMPLCLIPGAGHSPHSDAPALFCSSVRTAIAHACPPGPEARKLAQQLSPESLLSYKSSFYTAVTDHNIKCLYAKVKNLYAGEPGGQVVFCRKVETSAADL